jgi:UDP-N-acetyl-D-mannosaminuronate dehydrogenase
LEKRGALITTYDPYLPKQSSAKNLDSALANQDAVVLATAHSQFMKLKPSDFKNIKVFLDGRNAFADKSSDFKNAGIKYLGIGVA